MKFIVDEQLPPSSARWVRLQGHEAWHVMDISLLSASDHQIAKAAVDRGAVMVTKDKDYLEWRRTIAGLQVLWLRTGDVSNRVLLAAMEAGWAQAALLLAEGNTLVALWPDGVVQSVASVP